MSETRGPAARTSAHKALLGLPVEGLRADVARLALRVLGARLDGLREDFGRYAYQLNLPVEGSRTTKARRQYVAMVCVAPGLIVVWSVSVSVALS